MLGLWALVYLAMFLERTARGVGMATTWVLHLALLCWVIGTSDEFGRIRARKLYPYIAPKPLVVFLWMLVEGLISIPAAAAPYEHIYYWMWGVQGVITLALIVATICGPNGR